ncbi:MAG TPA: hypothetical protein VNZ52_08675 [Candidatus Thermoplasmatota archaeon]|nr:hypothetical protein [Candidatus Thermoplasmatota archaeon]
MAASPVPTLRDRLAPHLFVFSAVMLMVCLVAAAVLPKTTGDKRFSGVLESGEPVAFEATGDRNLHFYVHHTFSKFVGPGQNATLTLLDADGNTLWVANASVGPLKKNQDERNIDLIPSIPAWRPPAPGQYQAVYTYINGTNATTQMVVVEGGWFLREGWGSLFFPGLLLVTAIMLVTVFLARPLEPKGEGVRRFYPVRGATAASLAVAALLGLAASAAFLWVTGGGLTGF